MWWIAGLGFFITAFWGEQEGVDGEVAFLTALACFAVASIIKAIKERE
ncbi:hypothetical protein JF540_22690 [Salipiger thiooxidans]|nr:hypothetical protein [Salipiger thiooxidans]MBN8189497.1 hypothetical protein [Salipiger thiooxidans]